MRIYLTVTGDGRLMAEYGRGENVERTREIPDLDALRALLDECGETHVACSSSLDFPEEYTDDPAVVALCNAIRSE